MKTTHGRQPLASHHGLPVFVRRTLSVLGVLLLLLFLARPDSVQAQASDGEGYWKQHFVAQINTLLRSPIPAMRERGMGLIVRYRYQDPEAFDFTATRPRLYAIFSHPGNSDEQRILALAALYAIDDEKTSKMLAEWLEGDDPSVRVRRHAALALLQCG